MPLGTGRRKSSVARVRVRSGSGSILINKRPIDEFFVHPADRRAINEVLEATEKAGKVDVLIRVSGGGTTGQAGACRMGLARALVSYDTDVYGVSAR